MQGHQNIKKCLPEDESSGSKYIHVEDMVKIKLKPEVRKFNKGAFCWSVLCEM